MPVFDVYSDWNRRNFGNYCLQTSPIEIPVKFQDTVHIETPAISLKPWICRLRVMSCYVNGGNEHYLSRVGTATNGILPQQWLITDSSMETKHRQRPRRVSTTYQGWENVHKICVILAPHGKDRPFDFALSSANIAVLSVVHYFCILFWLFYFVSCFVLCFIHLFTY